MNPGLRIAFLGDIFPGGLLHGSGGGCLSAEVSDYLQEFDLRVGNLESAFGDGLRPDPKKLEAGKPMIFSLDEDVSRLREIGVDVVSLANNHVTDLGLEGLENTLRLLDSTGIGHVGAGINSSEAQRPLVVELQGRRLAFIAFYDTSVAAHPAIDGCWGVCTSQGIVDNIRAARHAADYVFVLAHWGFERIHRPMPSDHALGRRLVRAGADGVVGSHSHTVQPCVVYRGKPIFFSLGNFLFPDHFYGRRRDVVYPEFRRRSVEPAGNPSAQTATKFTWSTKTRIGMIAELRLGQKVSASYRLTYMDMQNRVGFLHRPAAHAAMLSALGLAARSPGYPAFFFLSECFLYVSRKLSFNASR